MKIITTLFVRIPDNAIPHFESGGADDQTKSRSGTSEYTRTEESSLIYPSQAAIQCDGCKTELDVDKLCKTCPKSLCDGCAKRHRRDLGSHDIVQRTGRAIRTSELSTLLKPCLIHSTYKTTDYCNDCSIPCCIKCIYEKHDKHSITAIETKYIEIEDRLNELTNGLERNELPTLKSNRKHLLEAQKEHEEQFQYVEKEVNRFRMELKAAVDDRCDKLLIELKQKDIEQISEIRAAISDLEEQIKEIDLFIKSCCKKVRKGGLDLIEYDRINSLPIIDIYPPNVSFNLPNFVPCQDLLSSIKKYVDEIKWEGREINVIKCATYLGTLDPTKPIINIKKLSSFHMDHFGMSVVPVGKDTTWIANFFSDTMEMYDIRGKKISNVSLTKNVYILDLAVKQTGDIIMCNTDNKVRLVTVGGTVTIVIDTAPYSPKGVCLTEKEDLLVCMAGKGGDNHVAVYSPDGKQIQRKIVVQDDQGKQMLTVPRGVVMNGEYISVLNLGSNVVTCDEDGKVRWVYDGSQTEMGKLDAMGMCIDKFDNFLISDYEHHCVHYVDREGGLIQILLTGYKHGIDRPLGIGVDNETGKVWVAGGDNIMWVFQYLQH